MPRNDDCDDAFIRTLTIRRHCAAASQYDDELADTYAGVGRTYAMWQTLLARCVWDTGGIMT